MMYAVCTYIIFHFSLIFNVQKFGIYLITIRILLFILLSGSAQLALLQLNAMLLLYQTQLASSHQLVLSCALPLCDPCAVKF